MSDEKQTFVKIKGQKFAYCALNMVKADGWIAFDRYNTKTAKNEGHMEFPLESVEMIETR